MICAARSVDGDGVVLLRAGGRAAQAARAGTAELTRDWIVDGEPDSSPRNGFVAAQLAQHREHASIEPPASSMNFTSAGESTIARRMACVRVRMLLACSSAPVNERCSFATLSWYSARPCVAPASASRQDRR